MSPDLEGTGRVADDVWLLAHSDVTGRPFLQPRPLGLGLAGALLAELVLAGAVSVRHDAISAVLGRRPPADDLLVRVLAQLETERQAHPVGEWLAYVARTAPADVATRLAQSGYLALGKGLLPWRGGRWVPVDRDSAFAPVLRVRAVLDTTQRLTAPGAARRGINHATHRDDVVRRQGYREVASPFLPRTSTPPFPGPARPARPAPPGARTHQATLPSRDMVVA